VSRWRRKSTMSRRRKFTKIWDSYGTNAYTNIILTPTTPIDLCSLLTKPQRLFLWTARSPAQLPECTSRSCVAKVPLQSRPDPTGVEFYCLGASHTNVRRVASLVFPDISIVQPVSELTFSISVVRNLKMTLNDSSDMHSSLLRVLKISMKLL